MDIPPRHCCHWCSCCLQLFPETGRTALFIKCSSCMLPVISFPLLLLVPPKCKYYYYVVKNTSRKFVQIRKTYNKNFHKYRRFLSQRSNLYLYSRSLSFRALTFLLSKAHSELKTWALFAGEEQCLFWGVMQTVRYRHKFAIYTIIYNRCLCVSECVMHLKGDPVVFSRL